MFCAQNGVANEDTALRYFSQVYGACVSIPATHLEPGIVEAPGRPVTGILQLGRYPAGSDDLAAAVAAELTRSGIRARACDNVMAWKRAKLLSNLGNALQVLCTGGHDWRSGSGDAAGELMSALRDEATACYRAAGWPVIPAAQFAAESADFEIAELNGRSRGGGSTWQSVQRGLPTVETDFLNGEIVRLGRLHGVPVPVNAAVQAAMAAVVRRSLRPASLSPAQLLAV